LDIASLLGLAGSIAVLLWTMISGGGTEAFVELHPFIVVIIGSTTVTLTRFGLREFFSAIRSVPRVIFCPAFKPNEIIEEAVELADAARKGGLLSLEGKEIKNAFMKKGVQLLVDGHDPDVVRKILSKDMVLALERHMLAQKVFKMYSDVAPAMGMVGTLIGLVLMMGNMSDPKSIGPAMAVALLATLYGAVIANMFFMPMADKLELRSNEERLTKALVIDALAGIQAGQNPRVIEETLQGYLPTRKREKAEKAA
jgi:chemotaxis protein MotA